MSRLVDAIDSGRFAGQDLDGIRLQDGEQLDVRWPDGHRDTVVAKVPWKGDGPRRAQATVDCHGARAVVDLRHATDVRRVAPRCNHDTGTCDVCEAAFAAAPRKR